MGPLAVGALRATAFGWVLAICGPEIVSGAEGVPKEPIALSPVDPVAGVGETRIPRAALDLAVEQGLNTGYHHSEPSAERLVELRKAALERLIRRNLNLLEGKARGFKLPLDAARRRCTADQNRLGREEYEKALASVGWSREDQTRIVAETILAERIYFVYVEEPSRLGEAELEKIFAADPDRFQLPEQIRVEHIFLAVGADEKPSKWASRAEEGKVIAEHLRSGESFGDLASKFSDDDYQIMGGDLGWVHRGRLSEPAESVAWAARLGEIVGPLKGETGYHILRVRERRGAHRISLDEISPKTRRELESRRLEENSKCWFEDLAARHPIVILDPELAQGGR